MRTLWPAVLLLSLLLTAWGLREWQLGNERDRMEATNQQLRNRIKDLQAEREACANEREAGAAELAALRPQLQELRDQVTNLQAQRDHLRSEAQSAQSRAAELQETLATARREREKALQAALEAEAEPAQLRRERDQLLAQVEDLEKQLDTMASREAAAPVPLRWGGLSADQQVFSLQSASAEVANGPFPRPVLLCRHHQTIAKAWIHRREGSWLIGHAGRWHIDPSTLVNGEKLFIVLPNDEEPHS